MHSEVYPSFYPNCHHQTVCAKIKLRIYYPPLYERLVWQYKHTSTDLIKRAMKYFDWEKALSNFEISKEVSVYNDTVMNVFKNFIQYETITAITCDDKCPWMKKKIKALVKEKRYYII